MVRPASARSRAVVSAAERYGLRLAPGPLFGTGHALDDRLRLPFTQPPDVLRRAVGLLARADEDALRWSAPAERGGGAALPVV